MTCVLSIDLLFLFIVYLPFISYTFKILKISVRHRKTQKLKKNACFWKKLGSSLNIWEVLEKQNNLRSCFCALPIAPTLHYSSTECYPNALPVRPSKGTLCYSCSSLFNHINVPFLTQNYPFWRFETPRLPYFTPWNPNTTLFYATLLIYYN